MEKLPQRIQRKRTKGYKLQSPNGLEVVYVGRPSKYGNPYIVGELSKDSLYPITQEQAVTFYKKWLLEYGIQTHAIDTIIRELKGKNLACWCPLDQPCHADILISISNNMPLEKVNNIYAKKT